MNIWISFKRRCLNKTIFRKELSFKICFLKRFLFFRLCKTKWFQSHILIFQMVFKMFLWANWVFKLTQELKKYLYKLFSSYSLPKIVKQTLIYVSIRYCDLRYASLFGIIVNIMKIIIFFYKLCFCDMWLKISVFRID